MDQNQIFIIIADENKEFSKSFWSLLKNFKHIKLIGKANNSEKLFNLLEFNSCDIVFISVNIPSSGGVRATELIAQKYPNTKVVLLSMKDSVNEIIITDFIKAGSIGYLDKDFKISDLLFAINKFSKGERYYSEEIIEIFTTCYVKNVAMKEFDIKDVHFKILNRIAKNEEISQIANNLGFSGSKIRYHISSLFKKTNTHSLKELIIFALKNKLVDLK